MKKVVTHSGLFHADDVFGVATLSLVFDGKIEVVRSRDPKTIDSGDIVLDVGQIYDPKKMRFDHHQSGGAGERENNVPYAAFGLIWKHFGEKLVSSNEIHQIVDENFVQSIDANDTGFWGSEASLSGFSNYVADDLIKSFNPTSSENYEVSYERFLQLVKFAKEVILREIKKAEDFVKGREKLEEVYSNTEDKSIIILDQRHSWIKVMDKYPEPLFVVFPEIETSNWMAQAVRKSITGYEVRKPFPKEWAGKVDEDLQKVSGVSDAVFCHNKLFLSVAGSKEGAIKMAQIAVEY